MATWDGLSYNGNASVYGTPMQTGAGGGSPTFQRRENLAYQSFHTPYKVEQSMSQFNQSQKQFDNRYLTAHAVEQQLALILKNPSLTQRCIDVSNLIRERFACNMSRNILSQFKPIVENIFGFGNASQMELFRGGETSRLGGATDPNADLSWNLKTLTRATSASDYDAVVSFLHPDGILFALIRSLMTETSSKFEFPVSQFPPYFRAMIEHGTAPPFFANKIISTSFVSASHLILNAFEYYVFHFGLYILNSTSTSFDTTASTPANEPAYFTLLKIYLNHFVPLESAPRPSETPNQLAAQDGNQSSLWQSLSSTTTSIFNLGNNANQASSNAQSGGHILPSLFKASIFQPTTPFNQNATTAFLSGPGPMLYGQGEHLGSVEWRCSTFLLTLTELWFGSIPAPKTNYILRSTSALDDLSMSTNTQPYCANIDQMTSVRIVIKHLHNFSNSFTYNPVSHTSNQGLAEIKQAIWTSKYPLQKRLYTFVKVAFTRWPMDYTFRQPLEAWLSYIQPWRYVKVNSDTANDYEDLDGNRSSTLIDVPSIDNHWRNFISDNLLYYTVIFSLLIDRFLKLDLSSSRNALMLFRVVKVYSQPGFLMLIKEAEEAVIRNNLEQSMNTPKSPYKLSTHSARGPNETANVSAAKLLAPSFLASGRVSTPKTKIGVLGHHLLNLENDTEFSYVSLFSPQMKQHLAKLLAAVQKSRISIKEFVQSVEVRSKLRSKSWYDSLKAFLSLEDTCFESKDEREMYKDKIQAEEYLNFATNKIAQCFEMQIPEVDLHARSSSTMGNNQTQRIFFNY